MYDARNLCDVRPGYALTQQSTCPIAAGDEGIWNHLGVIKFRRADETDTTVATTNPSVPILVADLVATSALSGSPTYDNGTAGVGASLERGSNGTFANQDGQAITAGKLVLVTGQSATEQNGLYLSTVTGGGGAKAKLVRVEELDQAADFVDGLMVVVKSGTTYADTTWKLTAAVATVGTDPVTFSRDPGLVTVNGTQTVTGPKTFTGGLVLDQGTVSQATNINTDVTLNANSGVITTQTATTSAATVETGFTLNNSRITAASVVKCQIVGYSGAYITNGLPFLVVGTPGSGTLSIKVGNSHGTNALNGTMKIHFTVL